MPAAPDSAQCNNAQRTNGVGFGPPVCPLLFFAAKKYIAWAVSPLLLASCGTQVMFRTDATVQPTDIGILRRQDYFIMGDEESPDIAYRG